MIEIEEIGIRVYGLMIGLGVLTATWIVGWVAKREKMDKKVVEDGVVWVVLSGIVGARAYHVIDWWDYYQKNLDQIVAVWNGGLGIFGAIAGGLLGMVLFLKFKLGEVTQKLVWKYADITALGVPVGQALGRFGNYFNQELYGKPTNWPWGIKIDIENRLSGYESFERFQPLFLYESLLNLVLFVVMMRIYLNGNFRIGSGKLLGVYLIGYGVIRFGLEMMRIERWELGGVAVGQMVALVMILAGFVLISRKNREGQNEGRNRV